MVGSILHVLLLEINMSSLGFSNPSIADGHPQFKGSSSFCLQLSESRISGSSQLVGQRHLPFAGVRTSVTSRGGSAVGHQKSVWPMCGKGRASDGSPTALAPEHTVG